MLVRLLADLDNGHATLPKNGVVEVAESDGKKLIAEGKAEAVAKKAAFPPTPESPKTEKK